jgi:ribosomal protein L11 methyltransferase
VAAPEGRFRLTVEPSTAFGSGSHESTQLMLMELEELPIRDATVLDVGTGSGILAIAATALGARLVMAFDVDPEAVWTARRGARSEQQAGRMTLAVATIAAIRGRFDNVLCNMVSGRLRELLPDLAAATEDRGRIVLSGILDDESAAVTASLRGVGLRVEGERRLGEWIALRACHA